MYILDADFTLWKIEQTLESVLKSENKGLSTIGDMKLTYEDYKYLVFKLKGLKRYYNKVEVLSKYKLSIVTAMVFSLRYDEEGDPTFLDALKEQVEHLQQHQIRFCTKKITTTFYELGIHTYGVDMNTIGDLFEVIMLHAGMSPAMYNELFLLLNQHIDRNELDYYEEEELEEAIIQKVQEHYPNIPIHRPNQMVLIMKELFRSCRLEHYSLEQLVSLYGGVSKNLIQACYMWCIKCDHSVTRLLNIR